MGRTNTGRLNMNDDDDDDDDTQPNGVDLVSHTIPNFAILQNLQLNKCSKKFEAVELLRLIGIMVTTMMKRRLGNSDQVFCAQG